MKRGNEMNPIIRLFPIFLFSPILATGCGRDCECKDEIAKLEDRLNQLRTSHSDIHMAGGIDEMNVTGLRGTLADPQQPMEHDHNTQYYSKSEMNTILSSKAEQNEFASLSNSTTTLETTTVKKSALYAKTSEFIFADDSIGSPFTGDIPSDIHFNAQNSTVVPVISATLSGFSTLVKPIYYYTYEISGTSYTIHVFNSAGEEVTKDSVDVFGWEGVHIRTDVIWTAIDN